MPALDPRDAITKDLGARLIEIARGDDPGAHLAALSWPIDALRALCPRPSEGKPYGRRVLTTGPGGEVVVMSWAEGTRCAPHDHDAASGWVVVIAGELCERKLSLAGETLTVDGEASCGAPGLIPVSSGVVHDMVATGDAMTVHIYTPPIGRMRIFDEANKQTVMVGGDHGAWLPDDAGEAIAIKPWAANDVVLIVYTTRYREGGAQFERAANTLATDKAAALPDAKVRCVRVETKREVVDAIAAIAEAGEVIGELHFVGHSGMYGPMFGTRELPEQFSPEEWRTLTIPFAAGASAYFHCCRSARWFAPFFARTFGVNAHGYHWYTTFSPRPDAFRWRPRTEVGPLYVVGCPGRKSHGLLGSIGKYTGAIPAEPMKRFSPEDTGGAESYDNVADLYDEVYSDIRVRQDEWRWLTHHLAELERPQVLDIGCGNGALLAQLSDRIAGGHGVDVSARMIEHCRRRLAAMPALGATLIRGPHLPFADNSFDAVISFLSFRYLDWDPILMEIVRVLRPGGRLLIVDMVAGPVKWRDTGKLARSKLRQLRLRFNDPELFARLHKLVDDPRWAAMLAHNPIRAEHELCWYLESRFPGRSVELLDVGWHSRVMAFDSGPIYDGYVPPQSYP